MPSHRYTSAILVPSIALVFVAAVHAQTSAMDFNKTKVPPVSPETLFRKYDRDHDNVLNIDELAEYVRDTNPTYTKAAFKALYGRDALYREAVHTESRNDAEAIALYGHLDRNRGEFVLNAKEFEDYLVDKVPEYKDLRNPDILKKVTGGALSDRHLHISKSTTVKQDNNRFLVEPARFALTEPTSGPLVFTIDAALSYSLTLPPIKNFLGIGPAEAFLQPTVEAHTSTSVTAQQDSISAKVPVQLVVNPTNQQLLGITSHFFSLSPVYETDHLKKTETYGGEVLYSPTIPALKIGSLYTIPLLPSVLQFGWRPYFGIEGGEADQTASAIGFKLPTEFVRTVFKLHSNLYTSSKRFGLAVEFVNRTFLNGDVSSFNYMEISPVYYFDPETQHLSLGLTYKNGYTSPQFSLVDSFSAWVGIKF